MAGPTACPAGLLDRLRSTPERIVAIADALRELAALPDPVGEVVRGQTLPNGLRMRQVRVPMGVVGMIYEARPNVTVDAAGLALKSGNAVILRGGSAAAASNEVIVGVLSQALVASGCPARWSSRSTPGAVRVPWRSCAPAGWSTCWCRAGERTSSRRSCASPRSPCRDRRRQLHVYVDASADLAVAIPILLNSKTQRVGVCNAAETLLVHRAVADEFLPVALAMLARRRRDDPRRRDGRSPSRPTRSTCVPATDDDWASEYLSLDLAVRVVDSPRRGARAHPQVELWAHRGDHHAGPRARPNGSSPRWTPRRSWSTRRPGSRTAASWAWAQRSGSPRRSCTRGGRWGWGSSRPPSGSCTGTGTSDPDRTAGRATLLALAPTLGGLTCTLP